MNQGQLVLSLPITGISNSIVVLSVKADSLSLVTNVCPGKITSAKARQLDQMARLFHLHHQTLLIKGDHMHLCRAVRHSRIYQPNGSPDR
jgi:hypothetical protein